MVRSGRVTTRVAEGARLRVGPMACTTREVRNLVEPEEVIKEVAEEIKALNRQPTTADKMSGSLPHLPAKDRRLKKEIETNL